MVKSRNDRGTPATPATSATTREDGEVGLLGLEPDLFASLGLGLGGSERAKALVLKGLLSERMAEIEKQLADMKPTRGRPNGGPSLDARRAAAVLGADDFYRNRLGKPAPTQKAAIELAIQIDRLLSERDRGVIEAGKVPLPKHKQHMSLFGNMTTFARLQTSVSKGLRELGQEGRFSKK